MRYEFILSDLKHRSSDNILNSLQRNESRKLHPINLQVLVSLVDKILLDHETKIHFHRLSFIIFLFFLKYNEDDIIE